MGTDLNLGSSPIPLREGVDNPWVSLLRPTFSYLCQFQFLNVCMFLRKVLGVLAAPHGGSPYLRMWRDGRPTVPTANGCRYRRKGDMSGASLDRWQGHGGRTLPPSTNPQEGTMERRGK
jgi:hypothetical protein